MEQKLTHWKQTRNTNYLGSWDLLKGEQYAPVILTIASVNAETVVDPANNTKSEEIVIHFEENKYKPMILNSTNKKALEKATGTPFIEKWVGYKIKILVEKVKAFGDVFDALRISPAPVETAKCECCGKEILKVIFDGTKEKCGYGVCSAECRDKMTIKCG